MCSAVSKTSFRQMALVLLCLGAGIPGGDYAAAATAESMAMWTRPQVKYEAKGRRDPFVQSRAGRLCQVIEKIDIETLKLTGVLRNSRQALALFASQTGPKFGYLLKDNKLFRENHQPVPGVTGKVINSEKVMLKQGDKQILFKLRSN